jgi:glycerol-3-phosphate dehydrogenase (NAD(P)+)
MTTATILGAGSFGTAFALLLARQNFSVKMWTIMPEVAAEILSYHTNKSFLSGILLPKNITATTCLKEALTNTDLIFIAVPSQAVREVMRQVEVLLPSKKFMIISLAKGLEQTSWQRMSQVINEETNGKHEVAVISGPSYARELAADLPTAVTIASKSTSAAKYLANKLSSRHLALLVHDDLIGLEFAGAFKNMLALAAGCFEGLALGENARAALLCSGFAELRKLCRVLGAKEETLLSWSGLGDLILTCSSAESRNFRAGVHLGQGYSKEVAAAKVGQAVEGIMAAHAAYELAKKHQLNLPIINKLYDILNNVATPKELVEVVLQTTVKIV